MQYKKCMSFIDEDKEVCPVCHQIIENKNFEWNHTLLCSIKCKKEYSTWAQEYDLYKL